MTLITLCKIRTLALSKNTPKNRKNKNSKSNIVTKTQVKQMMKSDKSNLIKYVDTVFALNQSTPAGLYAVNMPVVGTGQNKMSGNSIDISHVEMRTNHQQYTLQIPATSFVYTTSGVRTALCQYKGEQNAVTSIGDVLELTGTPLQTLVSPYTYATNNKSFGVIHDQLIDSATAAQSSKTLVQKSLKPRYRRARYDSVNSLWTNGQLFFMFTQAYPPLMGAIPTFDETIIVRLWFYDV